MAEHIGLPRNTLNNLEDSPKPPLPRTVHTIADALRIDRIKAERLAGLRPTPAAEGDVSAREAVRRDPIYTEKQRETMLELMDIFEQTNGLPPENSKREAG
jgi:DNA-binding XRE family transcriptional regulator